MGEKLSDLMETIIYQPEFEIVVSPSRLCEVVGLCREKNVVAIDTEFARFNTYFPIVGLIQLYDGDACYLIDPVQIEDISGLTNLIEDSSVTKIFHACSEDLEVFKHCLGVAPAPLFDTQIAAAMLGVGFSVSYQNLVEHYLGFHVPKEETRSDWLRRPLTTAQLEYAALDVIYLLQVYEKQHLHLQERGRSSWVEQECQDLPTTIATQIDPQAYYQRVKNTSRLTRRQLGLLQSLCGWREIKARELDIPRNRVVDEKSLFLIAQLSLHKPDFQEFANLSPRQMRKYGDDLQSMVDAVVNVAEHELPPAILKPKTAVNNKSLKSLKKIVDQKAKDINVAPEMLAKRRHLEQLLRSVDEQGQYSLPAAFDGWRESVIGHELLQQLVKNTGGTHVNDL
ncbi:MAG: ribonuclease D [bacterium]|nr:ribonuclease D [Gammaproteobacteria bacterium]